MKNTNTITVDTLKEILIKDQEKEQYGLRIHDGIYEILKAKWNGKKLNKRIETHVKEKLFPGQEGVVVYLDTQYGHAWLKVWGTKEAPSYNEMMQFFIGYDRDIQEYDSESFETKHDGCHGFAARERIKQREEVLANEKALKEIVKRIHIIREAYSALDTQLEEEPFRVFRYPVMDLIGLKEK